MNKEIDSTNFRLQGEFSIPFFRALNPDHQTLNKELEDYFLSLESQGEKFRNDTYIPARRVGIFDSKRDLFNWDVPCVKRLAEFCMQTLYRSVSEINGYSGEQLKQLQISGESWFHVTRYGGYHAAHNHPKASWSGVYMVSQGDTSEDTGYGGILNFLDPRPHANAFVDAGNQFWREPYLMSQRNFEMKAGEIVLFPSFMQHDVATYYGNKPRITVAFNANLEFPADVSPEKRIPEIYKSQ